MVAVSQLQFRENGSKLTFLAVTGRRRQFVGAGGVQLPACYGSPFQAR